MSKKHFPNPTGFVTEGEVAMPLPAMTDFSFEKCLVLAVREVDGPYEANLLAKMICRADIRILFDELADAWQDLLGRMSSDGFCQVLDVIAQKKRLAEERRRQEIQRERDEIYS